MSTGALFILVSNDGKQDKLLTASAKLEERLVRISRERLAAGVDPTPSLTEIEQTHLLFVNAKYRPYVAIANEYVKVTSPGTINLGQDVTFAIPQFGDFFSDMVCHVKLTMSTGFSAMASDSAFGTWSPINTLKWRWCNYPGERILQKVEFVVNNNPLDSYTPTVTNIHRECYVQPNKKDSWDRCVGQQIAYKARLDHQITTTDPAAALADAALSNQLFWGSNNCGMEISVTDGLQTSAYVHEKEVDLWIPLLFWFNTDYRLAIPSVAIPFGARDIKIKLAEVEKLIGFQAAAFGAEFNQANGDSAISTIGGADHPNQANIANSNLFDVKLELYINNLFVNPEIHEIFIRRIAFNLIRVKKEHTETLTSSETNVWLNSLKWPIESLFIGVKTVDTDSGTSGGKRRNLDQWHTFTMNSYKQCILPTLRDDTVAPVADSVDLPPLSGVIGQKLDDTWVPRMTISTYDEGTSVATGGSGFVELNSALRAVRLHAENPVSTLTLACHGVKLYDQFDAAFFSRYIPYKATSIYIKAPDDIGLHMVNFCLFAGLYQPSGHLNVSRAREFYLKIKLSTNASAEIGGGNYVFELKVVAVALNFLLISDGSAVLRYST